MIRIDSPALEVRDLRVVLALGEAGTTAAAADVLRLTQSAVSRALSVAEDHAGVPLFERTARGLVPTAAGRTLIERAPEMLADLRTLERRVRAPAPPPRRVRFAAECFMAYPWLARVTARLRRTAPELRLKMPLSSADRAPQALAEGELDVALLTSRAPSGCRRAPMFTDELLFVVSDRHPLAARPHLLPRDLEDEQLLITTATSGDRWFLRELYGSRKVRLRAQRFVITEGIVEFAREGLGVAVLSEWIAGSYLGPGSGLTALRLRRGPLLRKWTLAHRPEAEPVIDELRDAILAAKPVSNQA